MRSPVADLLADLASTFDRLGLRWYLFGAQAAILHGAAVSVRVAAAEDLVAMKVLAGRPKDLEDVRAILAAQAATIDLGLARATLRDLERALDRSDLVRLLDSMTKPTRRGPGRRRRRRNAR